MRKRDIYETATKYKNFPASVFSVQWINNLAVFDSVCGGRGFGKRLGSQDQVINDFAPIHRRLNSFSARVSGSPVMLVFYRISFALRDDVLKTHLGFDLVGERLLITSLQISFKGTITKKSSGLIFKNALIFMGQ